MIHLFWHRFGDAIMMTAGFLGIGLLISLYPVIFPPKYTGHRWVTVESTGYRVRKSGNRSYAVIRFGDGSRTIIDTSDHLSGAEAGDRFCVVTWRMGDRKPLQVRREPDSRCTTLVAQGM